MSDERSKLDVLERMLDGFNRHDLDAIMSLFAEDHLLVGALDGAHAEVFGAPPARDVTRWFSDASVLTRYGIATVNYGTSTGLLDTIKGENLEVDGLAKTAEVYARAAMSVCGVAG